MKLGEEVTFRDERGVFLGRVRRVVVDVEIIKHEPRDSWVPWEPGTVVGVDAKYMIEGSDE